MNKTQLFNEGRELIEEGCLLGGLQMVEEASAAGSVKASTFLGFGFYVGRDGLPKDYTLAEKYLNAFVSQASPNHRDIADAHCFLGCIHYFGETGKKNMKKALYHFKEAAEKGNSIAQNYYEMVSDKRSTRILKWLVMPLIFLVITGIVLLSDHFGWNGRVVDIVTPIIVIAIVLAFVFHEVKIGTLRPENLGRNI
jgi:hypothetical protein